MISLFLTFLLFSSCHQDLKYTGPKECVNMHYALDSYAQQIASKTGMQFLQVGDVTDVQKTQFCVFFRSFENLTLEDSQILGANLLEDFRKMLQNNPDILAYVDYKRNLQIQHKVPISHTRDIPMWMLGYRIVFWDKEMERPKTPYIAEILFQDSHFYFYESDPQTQALRLVLREPYEKAIAFRDSLKNAQIATSNR